MKLGVRTIEGVTVEAGLAYFPQLSVMPMGRNWAFYLAQHAHVNMIKQHGKMESYFFGDGPSCSVPGPSCTCARLL